MLFGAIYSDFQDGSNRTFMELKYCVNADVHFNLMCSNRTFMELKYRYAMFVSVAARF